MALSRLPPELLEMILDEIPSSQDLYTLIRASPKCFCVFRRTPQRFLAAALRNGIHPIALPHALAILSTPDKLRELQAGEYVSSIFNFLIHYTAGCQFPFPRDESSLYTLSRLSIRVSRFMTDYATQAFSALKVRDNIIHLDRPTPDTHYFPRSIRSHGKAAASQCLSNTEQARLQRAFFGYEVYCRSFLIGENHLGPIYRPVSEFDSSSQFLTFLGQLDPWRVEEMSCVHQYLTTLLSSLVNDVGDSLVAKVLSAKGTRFPPNWARSLSKTREGKPSTIRLTHHGYVPKLNPADPFLDPSRPNTNDSFASILAPKEKAEQNDYGCEENDMEEFDCFDLSGLRLFAGGRRLADHWATIGHLSYLSSRGLAFVHKLLTANDVDRRDILLAHAPVRREFLPEALQRSPFRGFRSPPINPFYKDDPLACNLGYMLLKIPHEEIYLTSLRCLDHAHHRALGWVFWDEHRIPLLQETLNDKTRPEIHTVYDIWRNKSVQERLMGFKLPRKEKERITDMFTPTLTLLRTLQEAAREGEQVEIPEELSVQRSSMEVECRRRLGYFM
ncbi:hypothetical protein MMC10_007291 [Thelotrema lepadinum]|nr:hypothetical protein [Thelotrema lepadinum]